MNHIEIKKQARGMLLSDFKTLVKPLLILLIINILVNSIFVDSSFSFKNDPWQIEIMKDYHISFIESVMRTIVNYLLVPLSIGYTLYLLNYIRNKSHSLKDLIKPYQNFALILGTTIIIQLFVTLGFIMLIIPGIIIGLMYAFAYYLIADNEYEVKNVLSKSIKLIDGYKLDYLLFMLSFIGWLLVIIVTLGIGIIWVMPYFILSTVIYYENLKSIKKM